MEAGASISVWSGKTIWDSMWTRIPTVWVYGAISILAESWRDEHIPYTLICIIIVSGF
ncbi:hypothetical protein BDN70DRAFT_872957 [Pholiota conissans]|uniref:Uncharacterized protein n=1 Tax=Pholiota conissans TaxID=109636 RepID=A0A9P6D513_9AGAR|nr:hypothetical protein BDN70DRAFT_872957 [Pholiota conissans]